MTFCHCEGCWLSRAGAFPARTLAPAPSAGVETQPEAIAPWEEGDCFVGKSALLAMTDGLIINLTI
jgi:hypothetical protein